MSSKKYKSLSILEKKKAIEAVERGDKKVDVAKAFGIPPSSLSSILKVKEKVVGTASTGGRKRTRKGDFPHLEECLVTWIRQCRQQNVPVGGLLLKEKAKAFAKDLGIQKFVASEGWLTKFKKRHEIVFKKVCGESASVDDGVCSRWHKTLATLIKNYDPRNIFNTDETGLFFKCLPEKTLTFKDEKCHGGKHSKDRVTVLLAVNMDGSNKLKPLVIGKAMKPRCFKGIKSFPTTYRANKKAWMTTELFNEWLLSLNADMKNQKRKILLFLDNCTVHNNTPRLSNVELHFFPPNTTSKLQPLDQGIIQNFKTFYRKEIVKTVLDTLNNEEAVNITVLSAMLMTDKAWRAVTPSTIQNCFKKSGFPAQSQDEIHVQETQMQGDVSATTLWDSFPAQDNLNFEDFVCVDDDVAVWGDLSHSDILATVTDRNDEEDDEDESEPLPTVTLKEASASFNTLRNFSLQSDVDAQVFEALFMLEKAIDHVRLCGLKQKKITDFFKTND